MAKTLPVLAAAATLAMTTVASPPTAEARIRAPVIAGVLGGLAAGALLGSAFNAYAWPGYYGYPGYRTWPAYYGYYGYAGGWPADYAYARHRRWPAYYGPYASYGYGSYSGAYAYAPGVTIAAPWGWSYGRSYYRRGNCPVRGAYRWDWSFC